MGRAKRIKISKKEPIKTMLKNYGIGGVENYSPEMINNVLTGIKLILENTGSIELYHIAKILLKLSDYPLLVEKALEELEEWGL
jgi:hypothetical protein